MHPENDGTSYVHESPIPSGVGPAWDVLLLRMLQVLRRCGSWRQL